MGIITGDMQRMVKRLNQIEILAFIIQLLGSYIFVSVATSNAQKQTVIDNKIDLRNTKEDLMHEMKDSKRTILSQNDAAIKAAIDILRQTVKAEVEEILNKRKGQ